MNKHDFELCLRIAKSKEDLCDVNQEVLFGCGLPGFEPVLTSRRVVAAFLRWQCVCWYKGWLSEEVDAMWKVLRRVCIVVDDEPLEWLGAETGTIRPSCDDCVEEANFGRHGPLGPFTFARWRLGNRDLCEKHLPADRLAEAKLLEACHA